MTTATAVVPTESAWKYVQQLCKHWAHKLEVELTDNRGVVRFSDGVAVMTADAASLTVTIEAENAETVGRLQEVVARHLDRFAFREAPLPFAWVAG